MFHSCANNTLQTNFRFKSNKLTLLTKCVNGTNLCNIIYSFKHCFKSCNSIITVLQTWLLLEPLRSRPPKIVKTLQVMRVHLEQTSSPLGSILMYGLLQRRIPVVSLSDPPRQENPSKASVSPPIQWGCVPWWEKGSDKPYEWNLHVLA